MSFLLGLLAGVGEAVSVAGAEASGSSVIGEVVGSAVTGAIGSQITNLADNAVSTVVDTIFGANAYENKKKQFYESIDEAKAIGLFSGDIGNEREVLQKIRDSNYTHNELINKIHNFAHDFSDEVSKKNINISGPINENSSIGDIMAKLSQANPIYYYLSNKLLESTTEITIPQNDPEYQAIAAVYNGKGLYDQFVKTSFDGTNNVFSIINEEGETVFWNTSYNTYTPIPTLYGFWTGINSINNQSPLRGYVNGVIRESWLDKCAFMHDISYHDNSSFNKTGDYQLISRLSQNMDLLVLPGEKQVALIAVSYFSSLGALTRKLMGPVETEPIVKDLFQDVYNINVTSDDLATYINHKRVPIDTNAHLVNLINSLEIEMD